MESESKLLNISKCERSDKLCRICLTENASPSKCLHEALPGGHSVSPASMVMAVARVEICRQDGLPDTICEDCLGELEAAHGFRLKCERSDGLLRKLYLKQQADDKLHLGPELPDMINIKEEDVITRIVKLESDDELNEIDPPVDDNYSIENDSFAIDLTKKNCKWLTDHLKSVSKTENNFSSLKVDRVLSVKTENNSSRLISSVKGTGKRIKQNNRVSFICDVCGKPMKSERNLQHHKNRMHSEERRRRTGNKTGYGANKRFHCPECPYSTSENRSLKYHIRTHTGDKPHKCELCSACFAQPSSLKKHTARHSDVMHYSCTICGKQFKLKGEFQRHKSVHSDVRPHICLTCSKGFKSKDSLAIHVKRHLNIRDYSCDQCGTTFVCLSNLIHHRKCHAATKDFECDYCGFRSISKPKLIDHIKRHISERPFKCELCDYAAIEKFTLKSHMRKHTREMNYSCPICHLKMTRSTGVNKHMLRAHGIHYKVNDHRDRRLIK